MKKTILILLFILIFPLNILGGTKSVLVSIPPLKSLSQYIGGKLWNFSLIIPYNANPHIFEPTPETFRLIEMADLIIINGGDIDRWIENIIRGKNKDILNVSYNIKFEDNNPHIWLDPIISKKIAENIYNKFTSLDPINKRFYEENFKRLIKKLDDLDKEIKTNLSKYKRKEVIIYHPAWYYFFKRYGIRILAVIEEGEGREPSPKKIAEIMEIIKKCKIKYIIKEPFTNSQVLNMLSNETGIKLISLDPLGFGKDYFEMMRKNLKILEMIFNEQNY